jgi:hypothetical protein
MKEIRTYKNMTVTKEDKIMVGSDWKEQLEKTGRAGHEVTAYEVIMHHETFDEVVLAKDPRFKEAMEAVTW